jgi:tRNA-specific 2-thiouridylase
LGQRQGLRVGGTRESSDLPWFVAGKDAARNALIVVQGHDNPVLYRRNVRAQQMHWIAGRPPPVATLVQMGAKTRYRMPDARCRVELSGSDGCYATFEVSQWAPTPGQYLVLYDGDVCFGRWRDDGRECRARVEEQQIPQLRFGMRHTRHAERQ